MTPREETEWVRMLGRTPERQRAVLAELLRHAAVDEMSVADRAICRRALARMADTSNSGSNGIEPLLGPLRALVTRA